jgi:hypothetical protein
MINQHSVYYEVEVAQVAPLLDRLATSTDPLWPRQWPAMRFDGPLAVGSRGGHGPIQYRIQRYEKGKMIEFEMLQDWLWSGIHRLDLEPEGQGSRLHHFMELRLTLAGWVVWWVAVRWLHEALIRDAFVQLGRQLELPHQRQSWSPWVKILRKLARSFG